MNLGENFSWDSTSYSTREILYIHLVYGLYQISLITYKYRLIYPLID